MTPWERHPGASLVAIAAVVFILTAASALHTPFPLVLSDEANYLLPTLHGYSRENFERWSILQAIPNHLYYAVYASLAGPELYERAKIANAAAIAAIVFPVYAIARSRLPSGTSMLIAAVAAAGPATSYARYFMPECLYILGFWLALLALDATVRRSAPLAGVVAGVALAALSLVKPHALVLAAAVAAFLLLRRGNRPTGMLAALLLALAYVAVRWSLTAALVSEEAPSLAPSFYAGLLKDGIPAWPAIRNALGHVLALAALVGVPLWVVARHVVEAHAQRDRVDDMALLALCILAALVVMTVVFSAAVYAVSPAGERITRLHGRYYAFVFPLLLIACSAVGRDPRVMLGPRQALLVMGALALAAPVVLAHAYETGLVDYAELSVLTRWPAGIVLAMVAAAVSVAAAREARRRGEDVLRVAALAWWSSIAVLTSVALLAAPFAGRVLKPNAVDHALATPALRSLAGRDDVMVVGRHAEPTEPYRVMFQLASRARGLLHDGAAPLSVTAVPADVRILVLLPGIEYAGSGETTREGPIRLVQIR